MYCYNMPSIIPNWFYLSCFSYYIPQNGHISDKISQEDKPSQENSIETRSRKDSNQFCPIIISAPEHRQAGEEKLIKKNKDDEYDPKEINLKKTKAKKQDQNRNVIPNTIHQIISFIQKKNKSLSIVQTIFNKYHHQPNWTVNRFYLYQIKLKDKINHYVNQDTLSVLNELLDDQCQVYEQLQQQFYLKVSRVLVHHFLNNQSSPIILTSKRMNKNKKKEHLNVRRLIKDKLVEIYHKN